MIESNNRQMKNNCVRLIPGRSHCRQTLDTAYAHLSSVELNCIALGRERTITTTTPNEYHSAGLKCG